ncbi:hypothetical protein SUGI_0033030 [Cryptomeria japonica]|nr:hypothetical protein SUGI_0033030 [Cryptomeria japonica]
MEGIIISHEILHTARKTKDSYMIIKLDILKAYDMVYRDFLFDVLNKFGFCKEWLTWFMSCLSSPKFSVLVNGSSHGFFSSIRGIRKGDPLSPFLFIIMAKALGQSIRALQQDGRLVGVNVATGVEKKTHLQFVDYTILFGKFLGTPFLIGSNKTHYWKHFIDKCKSKLATWKGKWLSSTGKLAMIKSILSTLPIVFMASMRLPVAIEDELDWMESLSGITRTLCRKL